ncbi:MAG: DinB family protein [Chloroflexota bacterium]
MNIQEIRDMYNYNYWANHRLLNAAAKVTPEQFVAPSAHSFSSLQATLVHTLDVELSWRLVMQGQGFPPSMQAADFPNVDVLQERWQAEEQAMWAYIDSLHDEDLNGILRYHGDAGAVRERLLWQILFHVVNHGMQHRSEAANLLTIYGQSPGEIDFTLFLHERAAQQKQPG